jgi:hypothetical protein
VFFLKTPKSGKPHETGENIDIASLAQLVEQRIRN